MVSAEARQDILFIVFFLFFSIAIGIIGYRIFVGFDWFSSFYNSCVILSGTGVPDETTTQLGKSFIALYSLYGGVFFLVVFSIIINRILTES
jgi:hypothetical protein